LILALEVRDRKRIRTTLAQLVPGYDAQAVLAEPSLSLVIAPGSDDRAANDDA